MIELTEIDLLDFGFFNPSVTKEKLNSIIKKKIKSSCDHKGAELKKFAQIDDPQFEHMAWRYWCGNCESILEPLGFVVRNEK